MHQNKNQNTYKQHIPVLLDQVVQYLSPQTGNSYLDLTAGYGGHASKILETTGNYRDAVLVDRDMNAITELQKTFDGKPVSLLHTDFLSAATELHASNKKFDMILADLGVSSPHLNEVGRGFSINQDGPLDMRMDQEQATTAASILNTSTEDELVDILSRYGEEPKARQIARAIVAARPLNTTDELAAIARQAWPGFSRVHPTTRTFQALRIAVNDEIGLLTKGLPIWLQLLKPGGRIAVISFHSLEDRIVKQILADASGNRYDADLRLLTKSPATADQTEVAFNPRARSAKLRAAVKK